MMLHDQLQYLPDDLLAKVDRASMRVSLEARVPILDHHVVEFSWTLPEEWKIRSGKTKWPLRQLVHRYLPEEIFERPKMGFTVPLDRWLKGDLATWAQATMDPVRLEKRGLYDLDAVKDLWERFRQGSGDLALPVWAFLVLEHWCEHWGVRFG
jgi:asparagine synthase (glutamine-hydrolysing)